MSRPLFRWLVLFLWLADNLPPIRITEPLM